MLRQTLRDAQTFFSNQSGSQKRGFLLSSFAVMGLSIGAFFLLAPSVAAFVIALTVGMVGLLLSMTPIVLLILGGFFVRPGWEFFQMALLIVLGRRVGLRARMILSHVLTILTCSAITFFAQRLMMQGLIPEIGAFMLTKQVQDTFALYSDGVLLFLNVGLFTAVSLLSQALAD